MLYLVLRLRLIRKTIYQLSKLSFMDSHVCISLIEHLSCASPRESASYLNNNRIHLLIFIIIKWKPTRSFVTRLNFQFMIRKIFCFENTFNGFLNIESNLAVLNRVGYVWIDSI